MPATVHIDQAAQLAGVSRRTIYNWMRSGDLPFTVHGGSRRVHVTDLASCTTHRGGPMETEPRDTPPTEDTQPIPTPQGDGDPTPTSETPRPESD